MRRPLTCCAWPPIAAFPPRRRTRNSLENQRRYFSEYISRQPDWELVEVYADRVCLALRRSACFRRMLAAAAEKIDLILTKEVSRFARNTVDTLAYTGCCAVRESVLYSLEISRHSPERR
ncbi:MAG: recombinase family protein [Butyricicoccus sp.]